MGVHALAAYDAKVKLLVERRYYPLHLVCGVSLSFNNNDADATCTHS